MFVLGPLSDLLKDETLNSRMVGGDAATGKHAENSEVLPCGSVAVQLTMPLLTPVGRSSGKENCASPLALVVTLFTLPNTSGRLLCWLTTHCESLLKYQWTVKVVLGVLFNEPLTV